MAQRQSGREELDEAERPSISRSLISRRVQRAHRNGDGTPNPLKLFSAARAAGFTVFRLSDTNLSTVDVPLLWQQIRMAISPSRH